MQKTNTAIPDKYAIQAGYTLDGMQFHNWPAAKDYLVNQGFTYGEAADYLDLLDADCMNAYRERISGSREHCFA